ncbi:MAG TPA: EVE domain-containing protein, partial [Allosphingosinicella sp.]|nr:EVE domain-containing protein [Allosphingosinicella sp.]
MAYWLMKSEPAAYGWADLVRDGGTEWDGVRNNAATLHLKAMQPGDRAFLYHSMSDKAVVGVMEIVRAARPDAKAKEGERWV